jgi:hypothetical protein
MGREKMPRKRKLLIRELRFRLGYGTTASDHESIIATPTSNVDFSSFASRK